MMTLNAKNNIPDANALICGVPFCESENTNNIVKQIGSLAGVEIQDQDISISHCLAITTDQQSANRDPAIILKFVRLWKTCTW